MRMYLWKLGFIVSVFVLSGACSDQQSPPVLGSVHAPMRGSSIIETTPGTSGFMYVANFESGAGGSGQISTYDRTASGNEPPLGVLAGPDTGLLHPSGMAADLDGHIWVTNGSPSDPAAFLTAYPIGSNGDTPPTAKIAGDNTQIYGPTDIAIVSSTIFVSSTSNRAHGGSACNCILEFRTFQKGDATPIRIIAGAKTRITRPLGIYVKPSQVVWVADADNEILAFKSFANGNVAPERDIVGPDTHLNGDADVTVNPSGDIFVAQTDSILVFAPGANGDVEPIADISGPNTDLVGAAEGISLRGGDVYASFWNDCTCSDGVKSFPQTASGNIAPLRDLKGFRTGFHRHKLRKLLL